MSTREENHPLVAFREEAAGRRAALVGTRVDVEEAVLA
jgi:hypothetical protein